MHDIRKLAIIGDGFAAAVAAIHLLRKGIAADSLTIIGPGTLGKGNAYGCRQCNFKAGRGASAGGQNREDCCP